MVFMDLIHENLTTEMETGWMFYIQMEIRPRSNCSDNRIAQSTEIPLRRLLSCFACSAERQMLNTAFMQHF